MPELALNCIVQFPSFHLALAERLPLRGITGLFGPSGIGKSTLLRIIAGLERRAAGRVSWAGECWQDDSRKRFVPPHRRGVAMVFQDARLFNHLSVAGNLHYAWRRAPRSARRPNFDQVLAALELEPLLDRSPVTLSGGECQRVAIARALLSAPRLLLMDEPLAALDGGRKREILPCIKRLPGEFGLPVIYVTHAIDELTRLADHVALMGHGRLLAYGNVREIMARSDLQPLTGRFEAGAVLDTCIVGHDERYALTWLNLAGQILKVPYIGQQVGSPLRIRIRARDVALAVERPRGISIRNILQGRIDTVDVEPGAFAEITVALAPPVRLRARVTRETVTALDLRPNRPVYALVKSIALDRRTLGPAAATSPQSADDEAGIPAAHALLAETELDGL